MIGRILALLMVGALSTAAAPVPLPSPSSPPALKEIIHLHSTSALCANFVTHANGAIDSDNLNDIALGDLVSNLQHSDMSSSIIAWHNGISDLTNRFVEINTNWKNGEREVNQLRALAATTKDPTEQKNLLDSANALGGALYRQRKIAQDLGGFIAYLNANEAVREANDEHLGTLEDQSGGDPYSQGNQIGGNSQWDGAMPTANTHNFGHFDPFADEEVDPNIHADMVKASKDYSRKLPAIGRDELTAAGAFTLASQGC